MSGLTIGELAKRTGVPAATLRSWESRYGFPRPGRDAGGRRRYVESDVEAVAQVLRHRAGGLSLERAVAQVDAAPAGPEPSVFAGLRDRFPDLRSHVLRKRTLLALTRAIEDESCAQATRPHLFAGFQRERFYERSRARYDDLARTAADVVIFADFHRHGPVGRTPLRVRIPLDAPLRREWLLVCDSADHPACLAGWELPGQSRVRDADRRYEVAWTVDARVVRAASRICVDLVRSFGTSRHQAAADAWSEQLAGDPPPASLDLRHAIELFGRVVGYVDRT